MSTDTQSNTMSMGDDDYRKLTALLVQHYRPEYDGESYEESVAADEVLEQLIPQYVMRVLDDDIAVELAIEVLAEMMTWECGDISESQTFLQGVLNRVWRRASEMESQHLAERNERDVEADRHEQH